MGHDYEVSNCSDSSSPKEEGELSNEEESVMTTMQIRFSPQEVFCKILLKVLCILEIPVNSKEVEAPDPGKPSQKWVLPPWDSIPGCI